MLDDSKLKRRDWLFVFALGLFLRLVLLVIFPAPYGNDAAGRLYFRDGILTWHWLPVTQSLVYFSYALMHSVLAVRLTFAIITSFSAVAFAFYLRTFSSRRTALIGGILFATNSHFVFLSLMPYQEIVFLGLLFGSLAFFNQVETNPAERSRLYLGYLLYGLACLTRYEGWFILPAILWARMRPDVRMHNRRALVQNGAGHIIGCSWGPAMWMLVNWQNWGSPTAFLFHRADHAFYAWDPRVEIARFAGYIGQMSYWLGRFGSPLALLALPGLAVAWKSRKTLLPLLWPLLLLLTLVLIFLILIASREFATANRFAIIPLSVEIVFMALGAEAVLTQLEQAKQRLQPIFNRATFKAFAATFALLFLLVYGAVPVAQANRLADFRAPYEIAGFLAARMSADQRAVVIAEHQRELAEAAPMPYQRLFGQLDFDKDHLLCASFIDLQNSEEVEAFVHRRNVHYLIVFDGNWPRRASDAAFLEFIKMQRSQIRVVFENKAATIYELATGHE